MVSLAHFVLLTDLDGDDLIIRCELIQTVEACGDETIITMMGSTPGNEITYTVKEKVLAVHQKIQQAMMA